MSANATALTVRQVRSEIFLFILLNATFWAIQETEPAIITQVIVKDGSLRPPITGQVLIGVSWFCYY